MRPHFVRCATYLANSSGSASLNAFGDAYLRAAVHRVGHAITPLRRANGLGGFLSQNKLPSPFARRNGVENKGDVGAFHLRVLIQEGMRPHFARSATYLANSSGSASLNAFGDAYPRADHESNVLE